MIMCLHQFIRPGMNIHRAGVGNCTVCVPSPENRDCLNYHPITVQFFDVKEEDDEQHVLHGLYRL